MQLKFTILLASFLTATLFFHQSCKFDNLEELQISRECDSLKVSLQSDVEPILASNCYRCHGASIHPFLGGNVRLEGYDFLKVYADNEQLVCSIERTECANAAPMPQGTGKLPDSEIATIRNWACQGALNN